MGSTGGAHLPGLESFESVANGAGHANVHSHAFLSQRAGARRTGIATVRSGSALPRRKRRVKLLQSLAATLLATGNDRTAAPLQQFHRVSTLFALVLEYRHRQPPYRVGAV